MPSGSKHRKPCADSIFRLWISGRSHWLTPWVYQRVNNIWILIRSEQFIHPERFRDYCQWVKGLWKNDERINFYPLCVSLHKIIDHGWLYMKNVPVPLGLLSEEPIEAKNKDFHNIREFHARKMSRQANLKDVFMRLYQHSDPIILKKWSNSEEWSVNMNDYQMNWNFSLMNLYQIANPPLWINNCFLICLNFFQNAKKPFIMVYVAFSTLQTRV